ncbi:hypothetical protein ACVWXN_003450 [Bradyrhizobium sp. i1.4.4]
MTKVARMPRASTAERLDALEERGAAFDKMAVTLDEICDAWKSFKTINWFVVKVGAWVGGAFATLAVVLTIAEKVRALLH